MKEIVNYLNDKLNDNDTIIVACSAGPDSMCLLNLLSNTNKKINIVCAHVNHMVRKESSEEALYVKKFCAENHIIFEYLEIKEELNKNFESNARKIRYEFFEKLKDNYKAKYILTAHHADDLMETILMRLTRGSTLSGYIGIKKENGPYLRPLLSVTKKQIEEYLVKNNIKYYIDKTNFEDIHTRNRYRSQIIPFLKKENASVHKKYLKFSEELCEYENFLQDYIKNIQGLYEKNFINIDVFYKETDFVKRKIIEYYIKDIQKFDKIEISDKNIIDILKLIKAKKSNSSINLPNGFLAKKSYNKFSIGKNKITSEIFEKFDNYYEDGNYKIYKSNARAKNSNNVIRLSSKELKLPLYIRTRCPGDKIKLKNLGTKKIKDLFIDEKIEIDKRKEICMVVDSNNEVLWIPGIKKSKFAKAKNEKYDIILVCERKERDEY